MSDTEAPAPAVKRPRNVEQNGVVRPGENTACGRVWAAFERLSDQFNRPATRGEVKVEPSIADVNPATFATQYGRVIKFHNCEQGLREFRQSATVERQKLREVEMAKARKIADSRRASDAEAEKKAAGETKGAEHRRRADKKAKAKPKLKKAKTVKAPARTRAVKTPAVKEASKAEAGATEGAVAS